MSNAANIGRMGRRAYDRQVYGFAGEQVSATSRIIAYGQSSWVAVESEPVVNGISNKDKANASPR